MPSIHPPPSLPPPPRQYVRVHKNYPAGTVIAQKGAATDVFYFITNGSVVGADDGDVDRRVYRAGDFVGLANMFVAKPHDVTLRVEKKMTAVVVHKFEFETLLRPALERDVAQRIATLGELAAFRTWARDELSALILRCDTRRLNEGGKLSFVCFDDTKGTSSCARGCQRRKCLSS
jgi:CRP-like cAMP-binding protein